jgi:GT2 family glycosyltransferase
MTQKYIYKPVSVILQLPFIKGGAILIGGNNMIRAAVLKKTAGYNTDLTFYGEDTDTAKRVATHGTVIFNNSLTMKTSARRYQKEGVFTLQMKYLFHFFKHIFKKKAGKE